MYAPIKIGSMIVSYSALATIPGVLFTPPAVWAPMPGVRESENMVRDFGVLIGVSEPIYLLVSRILFSGYYDFSTVGCKAPRQYHFW